MALIKTNGVVINGICACVPAQVYKVSSYPFPTKEDAREFTEHVGVIEKRVADEGVTAADLCLRAAETLLNKNGWLKSDVELLVLVTQTPDYIMPFTAAALQSRMGLSNNCAAIDISMGCSGWVYGLSFVSGFMKAYGLSKALLLAGETTFIVSEKDRSTYPLMGDAGTATAIEFTADSTQSYFNLQTFGAGYDAIIIKDGAARQPFSNTSLLETESGPGVVNKPIHAKMDGMKVLQFSLSNVPANIVQLMDFVKCEIDEIEQFVFHQANKIIGEGLRKRLKISVEKFPYSLQHYGNTSSASIPLTIVYNLQEQLKSKPCKMLVSGFGVGLSIASGIITVPQTDNLLLVEY